MAILDKLEIERPDDTADAPKSSYSRRSAASMKPKAKAASSVVLESDRKPKTRAEKRAAKEADRKKRAANPQNSVRYEKPTSERYKKLRILWWVLIGIAMVIMLGIAFGQTWFSETGNEQIFYALLFAGWGFLIAALIVDFGPVRKERKRWEEERSASKSKQERRAEKSKKAEENARKAKQREAAAAAAEADKPAKKKRFFK